MAQRFSDADVMAGLQSQFGQRLSDKDMEQLRAMVGEPQPRPNIPGRPSDADVERAAAPAAEGPRLADVDFKALIEEAISRGVRAALGARRTDKQRQDTVQLMTSMAEQRAAQEQAQQQQAIESVQRNQQLIQAWKLLQEAGMLPSKATPPPMTPLGGGPGSTGPIPETDVLP